MQGDQLPETHHIARYCPPGRIGKDGLPLPTSFEPRDVDRYLSVDWLESLGESSIASAIKILRPIIEQTIELKRNGRFVVLGVGETIDTAVKLLARQLSVTHEPLPDRPSHSGIHGYENKDQLERFRSA